MEKRLEPVAEQELWKSIRGLVKNRIRVEYGQGTPFFRLGDSKFGGKPHLPADFVWPWYKGERLGCQNRRLVKIPVNRPLSFLLQINLAETAPLDKDGLLPRGGLLSFFYELDSQPWGYDPKHRGAARVFWFPAERKLVETDFPCEMEGDFRLPELSLHLEAAPSLPDWDDLETLAPETAGQLEDGYRDLRKTYGCSPQYASHLLGYPDLIQNPMAAECEQVTRGYNCGSGPVPLSPEERAEIAAASRDWLLLFQMGTVDDREDFELMFGDCGCIYFWIKRQDLAAKDFSKIWLILQSS